MYASIARTRHKGCPYLLGTVPFPVGATLVDARIARTRHNQGGLLIGAKISRC